MSTIYIITSGEYSDYGIRAVFTDKALADAYINMYGNTGYYNDMSIEEWEADRFAEEMRQGHAIYRVQIWKSGDLYNCERDASLPDAQTTIGIVRWANNQELLTTIVIAKDEQHAIKVANERRTRLIAENEWKVGLAK